MGGGSTRKTNDKPIIRLRNKGVSSGGGSGVGGGSSSKGAEVCQSSFQVKVNEGISVKEGQIVVIRKNSKGIYEVFIGTKLIAVLSEDVSSMVSTCLEMKVVYSGTIIKQKNGFYARFIRQ